MKRIIITSLLLCLASVFTLAQKGLSVNDIFDGDVVEKQYMTQSQVRGSQIADYGLTLFRSIKFKATDSERKIIERAVKEDIKASLDLEMGSYNGDYLHHCIMTLHEYGAPRDRVVTEHMHKRYICYQCTRMKNGQYAVTLVYMEGTASLKELRKLFNKK